MIHFRKPNHGALTKGCKVRACQQRIILLLLKVRAPLFSTMVSLVSAPLELFFLVLGSLAPAGAFAKSATADISAYTAMVNATDAYLQQLADARLISGPVAVQKNGQLVYSNAFGWASEVRCLR